MLAGTQGGTGVLKVHGCWRGNQNRVNGGIANQGVNLFMNDKSALAGQIAPGGRDIGRGRGTNSSCIA